MAGGRGGPDQLPERSALAFWAWILAAAVPCRRRRSTGPTRGGSRLWAPSLALPLWLTVAQLTYRRLAEVMLFERQRLDLAAYDLHALRHRGVMELAWAGCDDDEIMSYSGHATKAMVRKYAGEARQIMRARQAREKRQ